MSHDLGRALLLTLALTLCAPAVQAIDDLDSGPMGGTGSPAAPPEPIAWESLSEEQRKLLTRFESQWAKMPPGRQRALDRGSARFLQMTPEQRAAAQQRFSRWQSMGAQDQQRVRRRWELFNQLSPEQRTAVLEGFQRFRDLPPEKRRALRDNWRNKTPEQRRAMLEEIRRDRLRRAQESGVSRPAPRPPAAPRPSAPPR
jgi:hypothetical protein